MALTKWDTRFLELAKQVSYWSKDPRTKVGCVLVNDNNQVLSLGFNGFPQYIDDTQDRLNNKEFKKLVIIHAEANAILNSNSSLVDSTAYITARPCSRCASLLIQAGVKRIVYLNSHPDDYRDDNKDTCNEILKEAGVCVEEI